MSAHWPFVFIAAGFNLAQYLTPYPINALLFFPIVLFLGCGLLCALKGWRM